MLLRQGNGEEMNTDNGQSARALNAQPNKPEKSVVRHALLPAAAGALFAFLSRPC
jgi:hypothetical protein